MGSRSEHLAARVEARRRELGFTPTTLIDATGLSAQALKNIRQGEIRQYQERLTIPLTRALRWTPDSIDRLLRDEEATPLVDEAFDAIEWHREPPEVGPLRAAVKLERDRRGVSIEQAAEDGGYVASVWGDFEDGGPMSEDVRRMVAIAFQWPETWPLDVAAERDPNVVSSAEFERFEFELREDFEELRDDVAQLSGSVDVRVSSLVDRVESLDHSVEQLQAGLAEALRRLDGFEQRGEGAGDQ
jgi:hypothetical protein